MARNKNEGETEQAAGTNTEGQAPAATAEQPAATAAAVAEVKADERYKMVRDPESGQEVKRIDFIRKRWTVDKKSRGAIAKELSELTGKPVKYQIVFQATKGVAGGPPKEAAATPAAAPASTEGQTTS
jgi:hypothetical protein